MTRFLLDSGIVTDYLARRNGVVQRAKQEKEKENRIGIATPVLAELLAGIERSQSRDRNLRALRSALPTLKRWSFDENAAFLSTVESMPSKCGSVVQCK
jgi:predicted nucleic acid-binding protein